MHAKKRILLKMFCLVFLSQHVSSSPPPLCLKDELSVIFSQSFLLTNLGKVNGSVHALLSPPRLSGSWHLSPWGVSVCVKTGHCEVCDSYTLCPRTCVPHCLEILHVSRARGTMSEWRGLCLWSPVSSLHCHHSWVLQPWA